MEYPSNKYDLDYRNWLIAFLENTKEFYLQNYNYLSIESIDLRIIDLVVQIYKSIHTNDNIYILLDLEEIKHPVCTLRVMSENGKESLTIQSTLNHEVKSLKLYRYPNSTPCPRSLAFKKVLEDYLGYK